MRNAIILMGLPLSGKTTWMNNNIDINLYNVVSADKLIKEHPDYNPKSTYKLHEWAVSLAEKEMYKLSDLGYDIIMDAGSINNSYTLRIIKQLKEKNYNITLIHIKTPLHVCLKRLETRERQVPISNIVKKAGKEMEQFSKLKQLVDNVKVIPYFTNEYIFIDMDGVIASLGTLPYYKGRVDFVNSKIHSNLKPVNVVIDKLNAIENTNKYILSAIPTSISLNEKEEWLDKYFNIDKDKRYYVNSGKHKIEMLGNLCDKLKISNNQVLLIEDTHSTILEGQVEGFNAIHVSQFLTNDY
jgi:predicted kinase